MALISTAGSDLQSESKGLRTIYSLSVSRVLPAIRKQAE